MVAQLTHHRSVCRRNYAGHRAACRLQPGAHGGRSGEALGIGIFLTYLVPTTLLFLPLSRIITMIGLQDSLWSLVLIYPSCLPSFRTDNI